MLLSAMILVFMFGSCISYQIIMTSLLQYVVLQFGGSDPDFVKGIKFRLLVSLPIAVIFLTPLSLKRDMSAFRYVSMASIAALLYTAIVLIAELPQYVKANKPSADISPAYLDWNVFTGCSMTFFAFQCQV
jgi:amino acid permease